MKAVKTIVTILAVLALTIGSLFAESKQLEEFQTKVANKKSSLFVFQNGYSLKYTAETDKIELIDTWTYDDAVVKEGQEAITFLREQLNKDQSEREANFDRVLKDLMKKYSKAEGEEKVKFGEWVEARKDYLPLMKEEDEKYQEYKIAYSEWKNLTSKYDEWKKVKDSLKSVKTNASYTFYDLNDSKNTLRVKKGKVTLETLKEEEAIEQFNKIGDELRVAKEQAQKTLNKATKTHNKIKAQLELSKWGEVELEYKELKEQEWKVLIK